MESVLHRPGRVVGQEVQGIEVVVLGFDFRSLRDLPAHRDEHVGDLLGDDGDGVPRAERAAGRGEGHVDRFGDEDRGVALCLQFFAARVEGGLHCGAVCVDAFSCVGAFWAG